MTKILQAARSDWLAILARASTAELEAGASTVQSMPATQFVRAPEMGMVMLRGRVGGTGDAFNLGEASVTRCAVKLPAGALGVGYALGRDKRKAELIALFDALLQDEATAGRLKAQVVEPLRESQRTRRDTQSRAAASSRVDFFTMVRGEA
jgi:alpha-D-ribose 1-methylphosphonate 5-triphosphate synthase subunit PhnG